MITVFFKDLPFMAVDFAGCRGTDRLSVEAASVSDSCFLSCRTRIIRTVEQLQHALAALSLAQRLHEMIVAQTARDIFQSAEMIAGPILGRDQQHENVHRFAVEALEGHAGGR